jgi:dienelactone hydrolase
MFEHIEYRVADRAFSGILATPAGPPRGGILVLHGGGGITEHERDRVQRLAALGYAAFAPDLFGEVFTERSRGMAVIGELVTHPAMIRARAGAAWRRLCDVPGVGATVTAAVGHCFGGFAALELARSGAGVRAVISFHGGLATHAPAVANEVHARVLVATGAGDRFCTREQRAAFEDEMTAAGVDWQVHIYAGACHGFTVPGIDPEHHPGCAYHELADRRSWGAMLAMFDEVLPAPACPDGSEPV